MYMCLSMQPNLFIVMLQVRFAALLCIEKLANSLGDEYLTVLTDTVPFLSELMEGKSCFSSAIHNCKIFSFPCADLQASDCAFNIFQMKVKKWRESVTKLLRSWKKFLASL